MADCHLRRHPIALMAAAAWLVMAPAALAQDSYNAEAAQVLAGPCASCHGPDGRSPGSIPAIAGLPAEDLQAKLVAFKEGSAPSATVMTRLMKGYDDAQIAALARYFSEIEQ